MAKIPDSTELRIKSAMKIEDILRDQGVVLHRSGKDYVGLCPFHTDKNIGSFVVSPSKNICTCYSCDTGGLNPIDTIIKLKYANLPNDEAYPKALRYIASIYNIYVDNEEAPKVDRKAPITPPPPTLKPMYWNIDLIKPFLPFVAMNPLVSWMLSLPLNGRDMQRLQQAIHAYGVGTYPKGAFAGCTIWWYIDDSGYVRTGKVMKYRADGHRDKESKPNFTWVHSMLEKQGKFDSEKYTVDICFFGQHLMAYYKDAIIRLVESEKTAIICSAFTDMKSVIWLASGGLSMMTEDKLLYLMKKGRVVELYPDIDGYSAWCAKVTSSEKLREFIATGQLTISSKIKELWKAELDGPKADIADVMVRVIEKAPNPPNGTLPPSADAMGNGAEQRTTPADKSPGTVAPPQEQSLAYKVAVSMDAPEKAGVIEKLINALNLRKV